MGVASLSNKMVKTEAGVFPSDWSIKPISYFGDVTSGTTPSRSQQERYFSHGTIPWIKTMDLNNGNITKTDENVTDQALAETCLQVLPVGTVLVAMYGGFKQIGRTGLLTMPSTINQALSAVTPDPNKADSAFLLHFLNYYVDRWRQIASSSRKDPNITGKDVKNFLIAAPSPKEQRAIAEALSDMDDLIDALDALITKKRHIKQGTMQQLLTGKKRLPGFSSENTPNLKMPNWLFGRLLPTPQTLPAEWQLVPITSVATLESGHTPSRNQPKYWDGNIPWVSLHDSKGLDVREIFQTGLSVSELGIANSSARILPKGTVVFSRTATIGKSTVLGRDMATSQDFANYICGSRLHNHYLVAVFRYMQSSWKQLMAGSTHNTIYMPIFKKLQLLLPPLKEQEGIAEILYDMDLEIQALEQKRDKTKLIKKGMMQELLTGKTRLI